MGNARESVLSSTLQMAESILALRMTGEHARAVKESGRASYSPVVLVWIRPSVNWIRMDGSPELLALVVDFYSHLAKGL